MASDCQKAQRYASLVRDNGVSRRDADDAASTCARDKASVESKKAALESARINLNWTTVTAPIAGRIGISSVTPGRWSPPIRIPRWRRSAGSTPCMLI